MKNCESERSRPAQPVVSEPLESRTMLSANLRPLITGIVDAPDPARYGDNVVLVATGVSDPDGSVAAVEFYRDANNDGVLVIGQDQYLGVDRSPKQGYKFSIPAMSLPTGTNRYFAMTRDNLGSRSKFARCTGVVSSAINYVGRWTGTSTSIDGTRSMILNVLTQSGNTLTGTVVTDDTLKFTGTVGKGGRVHIALRRADNTAAGVADATVGISNSRLTMTGTWSVGGGSGTFFVTKN